MRFRQREVLNFRNAAIELTKKTLGYKTGEGSFKWGEVTPVAEVVNVKRAAK